MLVIRQPQLQALASLGREGFEVRLVEHFARFYPRESRLAGTEHMRELVALGIDRAVSHGYRTEREASLFINLMIILGADFDRDPQVPWAALQLDDQRVVVPFKRLQRVHRSAVRYLEQTVGNENQHIARAMVRIRGFALHDAPNIAEDGFGERIGVLLARLYPQKVSVQGEPAMRKLIAHAIATAKANRIVSGEGVMLIAGLMLMLGSGFIADPMYAWAGRVLADRELPDENARVGALHREAIAYLVASLAPAA